VVAAVTSTGARSTDMSANAQYLFPVMPG